MDNAKRELYVLLDIMEAPPKIKNSCRRHKLELNLSSMPLAKACMVCGESRPLQGREIFWPAPRTGAQPSHRIWGFPKQLPSRSLRPLLIFAVAIAGGLALAWGGFHVLRRSPPHLHQRAASETLISSASMIDTPAAASYKEIRETGTMPQAVVVGLSQQERLVPEAKGGSAARPVEPESANIEGSEIMSGFTVDTHKGDREQINRAKPARPGSDEDRPVESPDDPSSSIAQRVSKAISARAISGVKVFYVKSILYLEGEVKTQSQRLAAEQAARNVSGVKEIRSSIRVEWEINRG